MRISPTIIIISFSTLLQAKGHAAAAAAPAAAAPAAVQPAIPPIASPPVVPPSAPEVVPPGAPGVVQPAMPNPPTIPASPRMAAPPGREPVVPNGNTPAGTNGPTAGTNAPTAGTNQLTGLQDQALTPVDRTLLLAIRQAVQAQVPNPAAFSPVSFEVRNGVVTLAGQVQNASTEEQLESLVQQVPGVTGIIDHLVVAGTPGAAQAGIGQPGVGQPLMSSQDQGLLLRIRQIVLPQVQVASVPVPLNFNVQQGVVTITGTLPNAAQKTQIAALVRQVPGVVQVNDQVVVNPAFNPLNPTANANLPANGSTTTGATPITSPGTTLNPSATGALNNNPTPTGRTNFVPQP